LRASSAADCLIRCRSGFHVAGKAQSLHAAELLGFLQVADKDLELHHRGNFADGLEMCLDGLDQQHVVLDAVTQTLDRILGDIDESQTVRLIDSVP
jgi:hypothetical protein